MNPTTKIAIDNPARRGDNKNPMTKAKTHGRELTGAEMAEMLDEFMNSSGNEKIPEFVEQLTCRTHRTLQQRIMGLFVACIEAWAEAPSYDARNEATVSLAKKFVAGSGDKYDRFLPFI
jgi:hypothetical protein